MQKLFTASLLLFVPFFAVAQSSDIATLKQLNEDWIHSYPGKDTVTLSKILADDLVMITPTGSKMSKKDILTNTASANQQIVSTHVDSIEIRLLGDNVGLVIAKVSFVTKTNGQEITGHNCYLDVYEKRNGKWLAVAAHVTLLSMK
jgi:uncharacterized protein (TIGR02246 family)